MKRIFLPCFCLVLSLSGCASVTLPNYIPDKDPTKKRLYADYDKVVSATRQAYKDLGFVVAQEGDPAVYEHAWKLRDPNVKQVLLMSNYRKSGFLIVKKITAINVYIRSGVDATDLELRYMKVSTLPFKSFYKYRNDKLLNKLFEHIEKNLQ